MALWLTDDERARLGRALGIPVGQRLGYGSFGAVFPSSPPWIVKVTEDEAEAQTWAEWKELDHELYPALPVVARVHRLRWSETIGGETWVKTEEHPWWVVVREEAKSSLEETDRERSQRYRYHDRIEWIRRYGEDAHERADWRATPYREELERLLEAATSHRDGEVVLLAATLLRLASDGKILPDLGSRNLGYRKHESMGPPALLVIDPSVGPGRGRIGETLVANRHAD